MAKKKQTEPGEIKPVLTAAVLYTDGGCLLDQGAAGWGVHGFTFDANAELPKSFKQIATPTDRGYVDAEDFEKRKVKPVQPLQYVDGWGSLNQKPTNNTAELTAAIQGLKVIDQVQAQKGLILTDSEYVIKGVYDYSPKWIAQNWIKRDGEPVKNKELWQELIAHKQGLEAKGVHLEMKWVKGHAGELGNESADKLATRGRSYCGQFNEYPTDQVFYSMLPAAGYWSPKYDYNRFLFMPCWYFVTNTDLGQVSEDGRHIYLCGRHGSEDDQFGKRVADHSFAVMLLKEREPILDIVKDVQNAITPNGYSEICIAYVDSILTPRNALKIQEFKGDYLLKLSEHSNLYTPDKQQLTYACDPPRMAFAGLERMTVLYNQLERFLKGDLGNSVSTDITDYLYERTEVKGKTVCKLSPNVAQSTKSIKVVANYRTTAEDAKTTVALTVGIELPTRNAMAAFAERLPTVTLLTTRESDYAFRYAIVIAAGDDVMILSSVYSNLKVRLEP